MPVLSIQAIGYGMGTKDFPAANCLRAFWGDADEEGQEILELCCNLDDMTAEETGYACSLLLESGALDVFTQSIQMKKFRSALLLTVLCRPQDEASLTRLMLEHTSTWGVRRRTCARQALRTRSQALETEYGAIRIKTGEGHGLKKWKPEFDDISRAAMEHQIPLRTVEEAVCKAWEDRENR